MDDRFKTVYRALTRRHDVSENIGTLSYYCGVENDYFCDIILKTFITSDLTILLLTTCENSSIIFACHINNHREFGYDYGESKNNAIIC